MRLFRRTATLAVLALGVTGALGLTSAAPAFAAAPGNDTYDGRVTIGALPFTQTLDTREATTDADDAAVNANCGAPRTDASVWYSFTPAASGDFLINVSASTYSAGAIVATGGPGAWTLVACGPGAIVFTATAGQAYAILAFDDQFDGGGNGGQLSFRLEQGPPPPQITYTVDPTGSFNPHTGTATIRGTASCVNADFQIFLAQALQKVGRGAVVGAGSSEGLVCDGQTHAWSVELVPVDPGTRFAGGHALTVTLGVACGAVRCALNFQEHPVKLRH